MVGPYGVAEVVAVVVASVDTLAGAKSRVEGNRDPFGEGTEMRCVLHARPPNEFLETGLSGTETVGSTIEKCSSRVG